MKTTRTPYGIEMSDEGNSLLRARRLARALAYIGVLCFLLLITFAIGALVAVSSSAAIAFTIVISGWGICAIHYLLTRH
jgi:hypothetical protein